MSSSMIELILLAAIALFVGWRLYTTLGQDSGPPESRQRPAGASERNSEARKRETPIEPSKPNFAGPASAELEAIHEADNSFNPREFLEGARAAHEMIVKAFSEGDRETLRPWLDDDVYEAWDEAISQREADNAEAPQFMRIKSSEIESASLDNDVARVTVLFETELGVGDRAMTTRELWTFMRNVLSNDPNWLLDDVDTAD